MRLFVSGGALLALALAASPALAADVTTTIDTSGFVQDDGTEAKVSVRYGASNLGDGATFDAEEDTNVQVRVSVNGRTGGWVTYNVGDGDTLDAYDLLGCTPTMTIGSGHCLQIRYSTLGWITATRDVDLPNNISFQTRVKVNGRTGGYKTHAACSDVDSADSVCTVDFSNVAGTGRSMQIRYATGVNPITTDASVELPDNISFQTRLTVNGITGGYTTHAACSDVDADDQVCDIEFTNLTGTGRSMQIRYASGVNPITTDSSVELPNTSNFQTRISVNGLTGGYNSHSACDNVNAAEYVCLKSFTGLTGTGRSMQIRYATGVNPIVADGSVELPDNINVQTRVIVNGRTGPYHTSASCDAIDAGDFVCTVRFDFGWTSSKYAKSCVRYVSGKWINGASSLGQTLELPAGINVQAKPDLGSISPGWTTLSVPSDCDGTQIFTWSLDLLGPDEEE